MGIPWLRSEVWKNWDRTGKNTFVKEVTKCIKTGEGSSNGVSLDSRVGNQAVQAVYMLLRKGCTGSIKKEKVVGVLKELCASHPSATTLIAESFVMMDEEASVRQDLRDKLVAIVKQLDGVLSTLLVESLNSENVADVGVVPNKKFFHTKFIRLKTKIYFKQQKYNLFREESEGYAKLVSELSPPFENKTSDSATDSIHCLIGRFNLDPNRVLDIVLEAFECQPVCKFFIPLLKRLNPSSSTVCEILGFKLFNLDGPGDSLFLEIALLIHHGIISLSEIYPWLTPEDRSIKKEWERQLKDAKEYARKSMVVAINKDKEEEAEDITTPDDRFAENQKFCLCEALFGVGDWEHGIELANKFAPFVFISRKRIAVRLIKLVEYAVHPLYANVRKLAKSLGEPQIPKLMNDEKPPTQAKSYGQLAPFVDMITAIGPYVYHDPVAIYKILRLIYHYLEKSADQRKTLYYKFLTVLDEVILPSMSFLEGNCSVTEEVWKALQHYPYHHRFRLYGSWKGEQILLAHPSLLRKRVDLVKKIKHLMRRISKENVKPMGRQLGKLAHSMPAVVFDYILSQVQLFDNLTTPVIDALRFLTTMCYDVLTYCLLEALSPSVTNTSGSMSVMLMPNRPRTKHDNSTISSWLQNLSSFTGSMCKKYNVELVPILQYISNQLKSKQGLDLLLLKEIVQKMTGVEAAEDMTTEQLDAMGGGELLRSEAGYFGQVRSAKKSGSRLREAISVNDLAVTLCILMAQQRNCIVYEDTNLLHTKLVGKLYDQCQDTLVQFGTFLANSCTMDDYSRKIPTLDKLVQEYHVSPDVAFFLWRPIFSFLIGAKYDELRRAEKNHKAMTVPQRQEKYSEASNVIFAPVAEVMRNFFPAKIWEDISPQFYVTFWSLSLYDLHVPADAYAREVNRIKQASIAFGDNKDLPSSKRKKEQDRCNALIEKLQEEEKRQREHVERVMAKLNKEKDSWFASRAAKSAKNEAVTAFLQHCLFPRCIFTAPDALYCAHFVNTIHSLSTPNFSTLICFDRIFCDIIYTVTSCTENEANRYGRFLCALLGGVMRWHGDKAVFDKECASFPGFVTKFRAANATMADCSDHVDYENFRHVCHKWHYKITKCIIVCLESKDFIQIRNALIILKRILPHFPRVQNLATAVERWIERVRGDEKDKRQDLFALATSYIGQLKNKWSSLVSEEEFHHKPQTDNAAAKKSTKAAASKDDKDKDKTAAPTPTKEKKKIITITNISKPESKPDLEGTGSSTGSSTANSTSAASVFGNSGNTTVLVANGNSTSVAGGNSVESPTHTNKSKDNKEPIPTVSVAPTKREASSSSATTTTSSRRDRDRDKDKDKEKESASVSNHVSTVKQNPDGGIPKLVIRTVRDSAEHEDEKPSKPKRSKARDTTDSPAANGSSGSPNESTSSANVSNSQSPSRYDDDDRDKKRKDKKTERKRERDSSTHSDSSKRKRTEDGYKVPAGQKTTSRRSNRSFY